MTLNVSQATYDTVSFASDTDITNPDTFSWSSDGTKLYISGSSGTGGDQLWQYVVSTPWDVSTAVRDGTKLFDYSDAASFNSETIAGGDGVEEVGFNAGLANTWSLDGTKIFCAGGYNTVYEVRLSTAWDISSATHTYGQRFRTGITGVYSISFGNSGAVMYLTDNTSSYIIHQFTLSTPYLISSASADSVTFDAQTASGVLFPFNQFFLANGTQFFVGESANGSESIFQFEMSVAWDLSTAFYNGVTFDLTGQSIDDIGNIIVSEAQKKMWVQDTDADTIYQYVFPASASSSILVLYAGFVTAGAGKICQYSVDNARGDVGLTLEDVTYRRGGEARKLVSRIGGLWCLEGQSVCMLLDGNVEADQLVTDGAVTVADGRKIARGAVGLCYTTDIETLNIEVAKAPSTLQGKLTKITNVMVRFFKSRLPLIGPDEDYLVRMKPSEFQEIAEGSEQITGDVNVTLRPDWNSNGRIFFRQDTPEPITIVGVFPDVAAEDDLE